MSYNILLTRRFEKELKRLVKKFPSLRDEYAKLIQEITEDPKTGVFVSNNCYKIRVSVQSKGRGKSGGARAVTYVYVETETVYLLTIYDKGEKENLKPNELKMMIESLELK